VLAGEGEHKAKTPDRIHDPELQALDELLHAQAERRGQPHPDIVALDAQRLRRIQRPCANARCLSALRRNSQNFSNRHSYVNRSTTVNILQPAVIDQSGGDKVNTSFFFGWRPY